MNFADLINRVNELADIENVIINEESTKMYLLYPFLTILGYDISNIEECKYECVFDMRENKSSRVDCAIYEGTEPKILIEAKSLGTDISKFYGQIKSYFVSSGANYSIITDGNKYSIFTKEQIDSDFFKKEPQYVFCLSDMQEKDFDIIRKLHKINVMKYMNVNLPSKEENFNFTDSEYMLRKYLSTITDDDLDEQITSEVYDKYKHHCEKCGYKVVHMQTFSKKVVETHNVCIKDKRVNGKRARVYCKVKFR